VGTEEDGVDEAGSTTQSPFITAPQLRDSDPDAEGDGAVIDNSSMSSSRTRSGSSRSGSKGAGASRTQATPRADANGTTAKDNAKNEAAAEPDSEAAKPAAQPAKPVPMPADGIRPSFTPAAASPSARAAKPAPSSPSTPSPQSSPSTQSSAGSSYPQPSSGYPQQSAAYTQPNYSRSSWSSPPDAPTAAVSADSAGFDSSPGGNGTRSGLTGGFSSTAAGAAAGLSGAAAGLGGAAAGLASSVTSAFRGGSGPRTKSASVSAPKVSVRRSSKRQAMLTLSRVEPWSVMKFSFIASVVAFIILFVAVAVLFMVLSALGVFTSLENQVASITSAKQTAGTNISHWFSASLILGWTAMLGALNIVLITALSTIGSVIYNLIAKTIGGVEVTLRETD
jgi:Transmembrane domain of unknown function (DUF3566)